MTYVLMAAIILASCVLVACTVFYIHPGEGPTNIQTTEPINVLGSQNVTSADKAARGDATSGDTHGQTASTTTTVPVTTVPTGGAP